MFALISSQGTSNGENVVNHMASASVTAWSCHILDNLSMSRHTKVMVQKSATKVVEWGGKVGGGFWEIWGTYNLRPVATALDEFLLQLHLPWLRIHRRRDSRSSKTIRG